MKTIRCFIAANIDLPVIRRVADVQRDLKNACAAATIPLRWVPPQNMHVTLRFLGAITEPMVQAIKDNVAPLSRQLPPLEFSIRGIGSFPEDAAPRVIFAGISDPTGALAELYNGLSATLERTGFKPEPRPFHPHVTLGRVPAEADAEALNRVLQAHATFETGPSGVRDILCYRSDLQTRKTDYHLLWRLPLLGKKKQEPVQSSAAEGAQGAMTDENQP